MDGAIRKRLRHLAIVVLVVVAVFGIAEAGVRARASVLPPPQRWVGPELPLKERQIDALQRAGGASVAFIGSSVMDVAVDPSASSTDLGPRPKYNASMGAASLRMLSTWARHVAVPRLHPDVVVLGVISREFNPNDPEQQRLDGRFFSAAAVRQLLGNETVAQKLERKVQDVSALVRYRSLIRQPKYIAALMGIRDATSGEYGAVVAPDGQYQGFLRREYADPAVVRRLLQRQGLFRYEVGDAQLETFRDLVTFLKQHVKRVVVVSMPVTSDYVDAHPNGDDDYLDFTSALERTTERLDVQLVDMGIWQPVYFADPAHVNARGAERLTRTLDEILASDDVT